MTSAAGAAATETAAGLEGTSSLRHAGKNAGVSKHKSDLLILSDVMIHNPGKNQSHAANFSHHIHFPVQHTVNWTSDELRERLRVTDSLFVLTCAQTIA